MVHRSRGGGELQTVASVPATRKSGSIRRRTLLAENRELTPSEIARAAGRSVQRVSNVLGALRLVEVVRYDTDGKRNHYRLKHPSEVKSLLVSLFPLREGRFSRRALVTSD